MLIILLLKEYSLNVPDQVIRQACLLASIESKTDILRKSSDYINDSSTLTLWQYTSPAPFLNTDNIPLKTQLYGNGISQKMHSHYLSHARIITPQCDQYQKYFDQFFYNIGRYQNSPYLQFNSINSSKGNISDCTVIGYINGKPISLTQYQYRMEKNDFVWVHTPIEQVPEILGYCQSLIKDIVSLKSNHLDDTSIASITNKIGRLHWWMAHACPMLRGSASITEAIIIGLFKFHGLNVTWKPCSTAKP